MKIKTIISRSKRIKDKLIKETNIIMIIRRKITKEGRMSGSIMEMKTKVSKFLKEVMGEIALVGERRIS